MAQVRALRDCFVGRFWRQGETGEYDGPKNRHLEPVKQKKNAEPETDAEAGGKLDVADIDVRTAR